MLATIVIAVGILQSNTIIVYDPDTKDGVVFDAGGNIRLLLFFLCFLHLIELY